MILTATARELWNEVVLDRGVSVIHYIHRETLTGSAGSNIFFFSTNSHFTAHVGSRYSSDPTWLTSSLSSKPLKTLPIASSFQVLLKDLITFLFPIIQIFISSPLRSIYLSITNLCIMLFRAFSLIQLYFYIFFLLCDR